MNIWNKCKELAMKIKSKKVFTSEDVRSILCDACRLNIPDVRYSDAKEWWHFANNTPIKCLANEWRNKLEELNE